MMLEVLGALGAINAVNMIGQIGGAIIDGFTEEPAPAAAAPQGEDRAEISQHALLRMIGDRFDPATMTPEDLNEMKSLLQEAGLTEQEAGLLLSPLEERLGRLANGDIPTDLSSLEWHSLFEELQAALGAEDSEVDADQKDRLAELGQMLSG